MAITAHRDAKVLSEVRRSALTSLAEMARWKSTCHAQSSFMILARIVGYSDEAALGLWDHGNRDEVIKAALRPGRP